MAAITLLRAALAAAIADETNTLYATFSFPPATPIANSVVIIPADPYLTPNNNQYASISPMANFTISIFVPLMDNQGNLNGIETMLVAVFNKLASSSIHMNVGSVSAPSVYSSATGDLLTCNIAISTLTEWS